MVIVIIFDFGLVVILSVALVLYENWLSLGPQFKVEEEVVEIDGCEKKVGQLLAELR
jgi:hypothetical protein